MTTRRATTKRAAGELPTLRITGPGDLVQLAPYLLGFHPEESLVVLGLAGGVVVVTVRIDLADLVDDRPGGVLAGTLAAMVRGGAEVLVGLVFDDRADPTARPSGLLPWDGLRQAVAAEAAQVGAEVDDVLLVSNKRWWSFDCPDGCCPPEGIAVDDESSPVPAAAAYAGLVALPGRTSLAALLDPEPADAHNPDLLAALDAALAALRPVAVGDREERSLKRSLFAAARAADVPGAGPELADEELIRFGAVLATIPVRDAVWLAVDDGRLDGRELWRYLGRRLPGRYAAVPLFVFGWASWRAGNGALAGMAADRALAADPNCRPADLLLAAVTNGMDPRQVPKLRQRSA